MWRGEVNPVMRPISRNVSGSMAKMTPELFTTTQPTPLWIIMDWATSPSLKPLARTNTSFSTRIDSGS